MSNVPLVGVGIILVSAAMSFLVAQVMLRAIFFLLSIRWSDLQPRVREVRRQARRR